ncbi:MAG: hypothetical protein KQJ78_19965 [Deltaproteobacteria bacterium]|nr:hypothetical protein [Deltaproteobacteria bacterium]
MRRNRVAKRFGWALGLALGLALTLALTAAPAWAGEAVNPCSLLTRAEAAAILGQEPAAPQLKNTGNPLGQRICVYELPQGLLQLSLVQDQGLSPKVAAGGMKASQLFQDTRQGFGGGENVPGLGQAAFWAMGLHVLSGQSYLTVMVSGRPTPQARKAAREAAAKALARLP